jgi:hypothetical protein
VRRPSRPSPAALRRRRLSRFLLPSSLPPRLTDKPFPCPRARPCVPLIPVRARCLPHASPYDDASIHLHVLRPPTLLQPASPLSTLLRLTAGAVAECGRAPRGACNVDGCAVCCACGCVVESTAVRGIEATGADCRRCRVLSFRRCARRAQAHATPKLRQRCTATSECLLDGRVKASLVRRRRAGGPGGADMARETAAVACGAARPHGRRARLRGVLCLAALVPALRSPPHPHLARSSLLHRCFAPVRLVLLSSRSASPASLRAPSSSSLLPAPLLLHLRRSAQPSAALAARCRCLACCHSFLPLHLRLSHGAAPTPPARRHGQAQGGPRACRPVVPPALPAADPRSLLRSTACCCSRARSRAAAAHCTSRSTTSSSRLSILPERPTSSGCVCAPCRCTREPL